MTFLINKSTKALFVLLMTITCVFIMHISAEYMTNRFIYSTDRWIEYVSVVPERPIFSVDEPIVMISTSIRRYKSVATYVDALICDDVKISESKSGPTISNVDLNRVFAWQYAGFVRRYPATCFIRSDVTAHVPPFTGVEKRLRVNSEPFQIYGTLFDD